jgi:hypothetical protein
MSIETQKWLGTISSESLKINHGRIMTTNSHKGTAKIIYDPLRPGMKRRTERWIIANSDREVGRYYRWWVKKELHIELFQPSWGEHISLVRGEYIQDEYKHLWKKYDGEIITFEYEHNVRWSGDTTTGDRPEWFWFVDVRCPRIDEIRAELGLKTFFKYHMTIGRTYY